MCTPIINSLATTITANLRQLAGIKVENQPQSENTFETTPEQKASKVLLSLIDLINLMRVKEDDGTERRSSQADVINNIVKLSLCVFIDVLNKHEPPISKAPPFDEVLSKSYAHAIAILVDDNLFDTKNDFLIAKGLVVQ